ncbi:MAG: ATP-binding protein [Acetobacteraceae bacterium]
MTKPAPILPNAALAQHIAILGKTGSGKTYTAKGIAERLLRDGARVCIIDPTSTWWGMRSNAKGNKPAFPVVVFGGDHADVPLKPASGKAIAEIIGTTDTSAILDTRLMSVGERTRFFADFAENLLRTNQGPLHLIIDEAHLFAPQGRVADPQSGKMLHAANNLVSLGRGIGLRIILITQRPAKLHKDSLTQAETLIALRLIAPQDRRAVEDWIGEWAKPKQGAEIIASLPSLPTGTGWVWAPELSLLKRVKFPTISTYDSSRAPTGEKGNVALAGIDLPGIQERLASIVQDAAENDPKRLRARVAELERSRQPDPSTIKAAEEASYCQGFRAGYDAAITRLTDSRPTGETGTPLARSVPPATALRVLSIAIKTRPAAVMAEGITQPQQRILNAMATLEALGLTQLYKIQIAAIAGVSPGSGSFANNLGRLRSLGMIDYPAPSQVAFTPEGKKAAAYPAAPPSLADLHEAWLGLVTGPQARILKHLIDVYPATLDKLDLARAIDVSPGSGSFANNLGRLRTLGVIDYPGRGMVRANDLLFPTARAA